MTHSGGKPHAIGDRGQRFEISFFDPTSNSRKVFGWSDTRAGAENMVDSIDLHPVWKDPQVLDRHAARAAATRTADADGTTEAHEKRVGRCREETCRARIVWLKTEAGKNMPVDADTVAAADELYDPTRHVSHFKTCKAPDRFSKGKR